jgi:hypothetical protein
MKRRDVYNEDNDTIPVIIGTTGIVTKILKKLETIPGKHPINSLQQTPVLETSYVHEKESATI